MPETIAAPTEEYPIVQSYLDTLIRGCLEFGPDVARHVLLSTQGWNAKELNQVLSHLKDEEEEDDDDNGWSRPSRTEQEQQHHHVYHWLDDRHDPIYPRGDAEWSLGNAAHVDSLLSLYKNKPLAFRRKQKSPLSPPQ